MVERGERNKAPVLLVKKKKTRTAEGNAVNSCKEQSRVISEYLSSRHPGDTQEMEEEAG